jgi:NTP pyrophosphatase (non-canonical NTP hydrolase)
MELTDYQAQAKQTSHLPLEGEEAALPPLLGLASEIGSILDVYKRHLRDQTDLVTSQSFFKEELGDLLWYTAAVATACGFDLNEIAHENLEKTRSLYHTREKAPDLTVLPILDLSYPVKERFPRKLVFKFDDNGSTASLTLVAASPNEFKSGPEAVGQGKRGFQVGAQIGATLSDNSRRADAYRFHDAIHLGFLAVLGWSPTFRALLGLKRKSDEITDNVEDGARAYYAEEGLAAVLAQFAAGRSGFATETTVDSVTLSFVKAATAGLEVSRLPLWAWRRAIVLGFGIMHKLSQSGGGYVQANLDERTLDFSQHAPE